MTSRASNNRKYKHLPVTESLPQDHGRDGSSDHTNIELIFKFLHIIMTTRIFN